MQQKRLSKESLFCPLIKTFSVRHGIIKTDRLYNNVSLLGCVISMIILQENIYCSSLIKAWRRGKGNGDSVRFMRLITLPFVPAGKFVCAVKPKLKSVTLHSPNSSTYSITSVTWVQKTYYRYGDNGSPSPFVPLWTPYVRYDDPIATYKPHFTGDSRYNSLYCFIFKINSFRKSSLR